MRPMSTTLSTVSGKSQRKRCFGHLWRLLSIDLHDNRRGSFVAVLAYTERDAFQLEMRDYAVLPIISAGAFKRVLLCSPATRRLYAERNVYRAVQIDCPFAAIIRGTEAEPSKKLILNHSPRSPSMSPWSETKTMTASCRVSSRTWRISPILSSI